MTQPHAQWASSPRAQQAYATLTTLQQRFATSLAEIARSVTSGGDPVLQETIWLRDQGLHGGGSRFETSSNPTYLAASVNFSQVQYEEQPEKRLGSATALSTIVHPTHPLAPSVHIHLSWTELKNPEGGADAKNTGNKGYFRVMADLNPSNPRVEQTARFSEILQTAAGSLYGLGKEQGETYFFIPPLERHRGVVHFYLENYGTDDFDKDLEFVAAFGRAVTDGYGQIIQAVYDEHRGTTPEAATLEQQLWYHTLYFFQVLTYDRGTTSGLLVHDQNDVGIMGSLPPQIDRELLGSWAAKTPAPQDELVAKLLECLPRQNPAAITIPVKQQLAKTIRDHYRVYPEALNLQAKMPGASQTVHNHT